MDTVPMTPEGYEQLLKKIAHLKDVEIPRLQKALGDAREQGDLSENAEFDAAREGLWNADQMLAELNDRQARAEVIDDRRRPTDTIAIGALLKVENITAKMNDELLLVGESETRPEYDCVSVVSPLGAAFIGKKVGDIVEVQAPRGLMKFKVLEFRYL